MTDDPRPGKPESRQSGERDETSESDGSPEADQAAETEWQRRRRLASVFGDVLPDTTSDERDSESPRDDGDAQDRWLRSQVPPHHG
jgi:hypothetical protein